MRREIVIPKHTVQWKHNSKEELEKMPCTQHMIHFEDGVTIIVQRQGGSVSMEVRYFQEGREE